ncbi:MalY/PatB family protein [Enterococcus raffinosus]|uniref:cysteine-S-conjugate beta-lyase n=1 Tax=Enterococcus raffinosus TaxID=71452 RepID=A0AAW8SZQ2_9ENTE|nr:aminotransferase class I/II-fold pyridoxal phosphate-dependent enzyme [Enterococcus raffinosus]MBS6431350.1 aminotransferase class I/II-fold pyridoxal phosphate-dependent enzyme [Enterococcus raffinosus]MDK7991027.1 aminotransferase class I/II-fold pyridoxal phosphate-dependent enzyme [Enterococcus raffinosus]MDT2539147.1 aminotransferase class I/II-fold pyridoxal phosphate-dependent enzyme [Enterococcus raffinosus]MDT2572612.1 aminotransferase class I/II-fold pyridoxal phosphate-dependent e
MSNFREQRSRYDTYSTQWDYVQDRFGVKNLLPFSISDTDFMIPGGTIDVLSNAVERGFFGYTRWNHLDYKQSISRWFQQAFTCWIDPNWCVYSPSVIYSLSVCLQLLSKTGEKIVTFTPCYDAFFNCISGNERALITFSLTNDKERFTIDFSALEEIFAAEKPAIFLLCNPHNPTGRVFTEEELTHLITLCNKYSVAIISDEIHMDVRRPGKKHLPILAFINQIEVPVVLLSSASKTFNSPGLGGSYGIFPEEVLREKFLNILKGRDGLSSIPYPALLATMDCYNNQKQWVEELNRTVDENFTALKGILAKDPRIDFRVPEATYLGWINIAKLPYTMDELQTVLVKKEKVAIMKGETYGVEGQRYLRFNLGAPKEKIVDGAERLLRAIRSLDERSSK